MPLMHNQRMGADAARFPFLNRREEAGRLRSLLHRKEGALAVLYGRRRCGKSRLLREVLPARRSAYYVGDDRESALQRGNLAAEIGRLLPGFDQVHYPDWAALLARLWREAPRGTVLALDEFPALVWAAPELPSLLQKHLDGSGSRRIHLVLCSSSQRMMQGLVLDRNAPLYGRAREILKIAPLAAGWIRKALRLGRGTSAVDAYAVWGGVPRYWELAADFSNLNAAVRALVLSPLGVLHDEPEGLLLDDLRDVTQPLSILSLIGRGSHRLSEIGARLQKPATSLSRPLRRLIDLDLVRRDVPFGVSPKDAKRTLYRIADPFLRFWFRFVEPHRSLLEARRIDAVARAVALEFPRHVASVWEDLARDSVAWLGCFGRRWRPASRWWGPGVDRSPMKIDVVAESEDGEALLLGEAKWSNEAISPTVAQQLERKAAKFPLVRGRKTYLAVWCPRPSARLRGVATIGPDQVLRVLT